MKQQAMLMCSFSLSLTPGDMECAKPSKDKVMIWCLGRERKYWLQSHQAFCSAVEI